MSRIQQAVSALFIFLFCFSGYAQNELNPYKYIIVPKQYDFLKEENQYRVNSMTKYLFEQEGYTTFYQGDEYPADLNANPCLAATALVLNESSAFTTKLVISLKDCRDKEVYRTAEGKSKIKEFDKTYIDALKKCFVSIQDLDYSFEESLVVNAAAKAMMASEQPKAVAETPTMQKAEEKPAALAVAAVPVEKSTAEPSRAAVAAVPVVIAEKPKEEEPVEVVAEEKAAAGEETTEATQLTGGARAFKNETTTFLLVDQGTQMQAFVSESKNKNYKPGELIGTFRKTSLPNVFRVSWKKPQKDIDDTTAYFDEQGNLKIDIVRNDKIEVLTFTQVK